MLTINVIFDERYSERFAPWFELNPLLSDLSLNLLKNDESERADAVIVQSHLLQDLRIKNDRRVRGPVIVNDRADEEIVSVLYREFIKDPNTLGWLKECTIRDPALHNAPHVQSYYHYTLLRHDSTKYPTYPHEILLDQTDIDKIELPFSVASYARFGELRARASTGAAQRDIDVFMYGTTVYADEILQDHRCDAARGVGRLGTLRTLLSVGYILGHEQLADMLFRSRIVVSPYGYCMSSYKDWEALYAGCVLIKPDSSLQVNYLPDLYAGNRWYVPCATDFSDLEEKVAMVLDDYNTYYERAQEARAALMNSMNREQRAVDFSNMIGRVLARTPDASFAPYVVSPPAKVDIDHAEPALGKGESNDHALGGVNLLGNGADDLADANWTKVRARLEACPEPGPGGTPVWKLVEDTSDSTHDVRRGASGGEKPWHFTLSFFAKAGERSQILAWLYDYDGNDRAQAGFDLKGGPVWSVRTYRHGWSEVVADAVRLDGGWYWCWLAARLDHAPKHLTALLTLDGEQRQGGYVGDGQSGAFLGGVRLEQGPRPTLVLPHKASPIDGTAPGVSQ